MSFYTEVAFPWVVSIEKGFQNDPNDKGNWTGGEVGKGELKGTKYGVSAMAYPNLDIENLTVADAADIFKADYWDRFQGDLMQNAVALGVFDMAVNSGTHEAVVVLQRCLALPEDGSVGRLTLAALSTRDPRALAQQYCVERIMAYHEMPEWTQYGQSWATRARATATKAQSC